MVNEWDPALLEQDDTDEGWLQALTQLRQDVEHARAIESISPVIGNEGERAVWAALCEGRHVTWGDLAGLSPTLACLYECITGLQSPEPYRQYEELWRGTYASMIRRVVGRRRREHPSYNPYVVRERILESQEAFNTADAVLHDLLLARDRSRVRSSRA